MQGFAAKGMLSQRLLRVLAAGAVCWLIPAAKAQVFTVTPGGIDGHYLDFQPTNVPLPNKPLNGNGQQLLIRFFTAEQGYAMRPLPRASKGLTLHANGGMSPSGSDYVNELTEHGTSAKPGERCVVTDIKIKGDRMIFELNGGPDPKHKWLRHVSLGTNPNYTTPVVADSQEPVGSRITLVFAHDVPNVNGTQVEALLAPLLGFGVKSPIEAYTETLPPKLKEAILDHHVLVGMSTEMVTYALGAPQQKIRERDGQMPFEEWIYGEAPKPVQFVRINGNRVIRVEVAEVGKPLVIRAENEMGDYWNTVPNPNVHLVKLGDEDPASAAKQSAPQSPPSLRMPGEKLPTDDDKDHPTMQPVQFPKDSGSGSDQQKTQQPAASSPSPSPSTQPKPADSSAPQQYVASSATHQ